MELVPADRLYSTDHEWVLDIGDGRFKVGITYFAQDALGDIVFVNLPTEGSDAAEATSIGEVESTKSVSDLYAPIDGKIVAVNEALVDDPAALNRDPYGDGWICVIEGTPNPKLLDAVAYKAQTA